jgi:hypothetical protein
VPAATIVHGPAGDGSAAEQLEGVSPAVCEGAPAEGPNIDGAEQVAQCSNTSLEDPVLVLGAVAAGQFWVITVEGSAPEDERNQFLGSIELSALDPTP